MLMKLFNLHEKDYLIINRQRNSSIDEKYRRERERVFFFFRR